MDRKNTAVKFTVKFILFTIVFIILFFIISRLGYITAGKAMFPDYNTVYTDKTVVSDKKIIVIDPGHGGQDNGASGVGGIKEKDINLSVSKMLGEILSVMDFDVKYTRDADKFAGNGESFIKREDLSYRVKYTRSFEDPVFVSIHMNKFPIPKYSGTQTFYSKNSPSSELLALKIQRAVKMLIQPHNTREIKKASSAIFVLDRLEAPAVLVECGFISNPSEAQLLSSKEYQRKIAFCIAMGIADYFKKES